MKMSSSRRFWLLIVVLVAGGILVNSWTYLGEAHVERKELKNFPIQVGDWKQVGVDGRFDAQTMSVLRASVVRVPRWTASALSADVANTVTSVLRGVIDGPSPHRTGAADEQRLPESIFEFADG